MTDLFEVNSLTLVCVGNSVLSQIQSSDHISLLKHPFGAKRIRIFLLKITLNHTQEHKRLKRTRFC